MSGPIERAGFVPVTAGLREVELYRRDEVALIALHKHRDDARAARRAANPLDPPLIAELQGAFAALRADGGRAPVILTSALLSAFSRGARIELILESSEEGCRRFIREAQELILTIQRFPRPVIAAVNGLALGGGLELAMACDLRLAADHWSVQLGLPEASLGLIPGMGGTQNLRRLVGDERAARIMIEARADVSAAEALEIGLVDRVVPLEGLLEAAFRVARGGGPRKAVNLPAERPDDLSEVRGFCLRQEIEEHLARTDLGLGSGGRAAPLARALLSLLLQRTSPAAYLEGLRWEREVIAWLQGTRDLHEGIRAMVEERQPMFTGR